MDNECDVRTDANQSCPVEMGNQQPLGLRVDLDPGSSHAFPGP